MYRGTFQDVVKNKYTVDIIPIGTENEVIEITLSANPVEITRKSEGLFSEIKPLGCTIEIVTDKIYPDMYATSIKDVEVNIYMNGDTKIFSGYLSPYAYSQPFAHTVDTLQLEAVSKLSVLKDIKYASYSTKYKSLRTFANIIWEILVDGAGYDEKTLKIQHLSLPIKNLLTSFNISEANFFDDDDENTPWTMEDILIQICRYLGVSCLDIDNDTIRLIDYQKIGKIDSPSLNELKRNGNGQLIYSSKLGQLKTVQITKDDYMSDDATFSFDEIYNKFEVEVNAYNIDELCPDVTNYDNSYDAMSYAGSVAYNSSKWSDTQKSINYNVYQLTRFLKDDTHWKHRYFCMRNSWLPELEHYEDTDFYEASFYNMMSLPQINTRCASISRVAKWNENETKPMSIDFDTYISFYCLDDTSTPLSEPYKVNSFRIKEGELVLSGNLPVHCTDVEQNVLTYESPEHIRYCPENGTSWITIKGALWYQQNIIAENRKIYIVNTSQSTYVQYPIDGMAGISPYKPYASSSFKENGAFFNPDAIIKRFPTRAKGTAGYGTGFPMMKFRLQIGNYYWDGANETWTSTPTDFYVNFGNNPKNGDEESFYCLSWQSVTPNKTFESKIDDDCWAIPIDKAHGGEKVCGKMTLRMYNPSQLGPMYDDANIGVNWQVLFPVIYMKGFELNYIYTDDKQWVLEKNDKDDDIVYSNSVYTTYNRPYKDSIECKINSYADNVPISKSYVLDSSNKFIGKGTNTGSTTTSSQIMEYFIIDRMLEHHQSKKIVFEATIRYKDKGKDVFNPTTRHRLNFTEIDTFTDDGIMKPFVVDSYTHNVSSNTVKVKFIEW